MGGSAFPNLNISRIASSTLPGLLSHITTLLSPYYKIHSPPSAPGKTSHGDLDLLLLPVTTPPELKPLLSAIASTKTRNSPTTSFAVPFPFALSPDPGALFQLDIHVCHSQQDLEWTLFQHSYGDFWNIVGTMARRVGLKIDDKGLHLRMEEGKTLLLTQKPEEVLEFFGFEELGGWGELEDMFKFLRGCRFFAIEAFESENESKKDRQRGKKRDGWIKWKESLERLPAVEGKALEKDEVRIEALERFGKAAEYEERMSESEKRANDKKMWREIMERLPLETAREKGLTMRGLKNLWESEPGRDAKTLPEFVKTHWNEEWLKALGREMQAAMMPKHKTKGNGDDTMVVLGLK
jgi:hypothetical protein